MPDLQGWFHTPVAANKSVQRSVGVLLAGFKQISNTCNSTQVIFSDRPDKRASGKSDWTFASVNSGDTMPVIYIFKLFLDSGAGGAGQNGQLWLCALTIIHELSHKLVRTDDIRYDQDGLKPNLIFSVHKRFTSKQAINNADSWGYFAADLMGMLPKEKFEEFYQ